MENKLILTATLPENETRLDAFLTQRVPTFSRSYFQELIKERFVLVNNAVVPKSYRIQPEDTVNVTFRPAPTLVTNKEIPADIGIEVLYENKDFMVIYKPAGLLVHAPNLRSEQVTVVDWLIKRYEDVENVGCNERPGIVHRLDKDTSGVMILAKTHHAHGKFTKMFHDRTISKTYYALVHGHPDREGSIDFPINRDRKVRHRMTHIDRAGRASLTHYTVDTYFKNTTLLKVTPVTGRTHQIRVHCSAIGHSLVGDHLYGRVDKRLKRQALHAYNLSFEFDGVPYSFTKKIPADLQRCIDIQEESATNPY